MPTSKIRVASQGPYADWLVNENKVRADCYGAWYPAEWQPPYAGPKKSGIRVDTVSGAECTITWSK